MGFSQDHAAEALVACGNSFSLAMDWILNHPPTIPSVVRRPAIGYREINKGALLVVLLVF